LVEHLRAVLPAARAFLGASLSAARKMARPGKLPLIEAEDPGKAGVAGAGDALAWHCGHTLTNYAHRATGVPLPSAEFCAHRSFRKVACRVAVSFSAFVGMSDLNSTLTAVE
jgi:hypothetical protein